MSNQLTQRRTSILLPENYRHLLFFVSFSLLPFFAFNRFRWNVARFGLDQLHLGLLQLLFTLFLSQKLLSQKDRSPIISENQETGGNLEEGEDKKQGDQPTTSNKSLEMVKSLKTLVDRSTDWVTVFPTPGLEILQHRSFKSVYAVRSEVEEDNVTLEQLVRCLRESKQWEWDRMCECGEDLGEGISWVRLKGFWPIKPKELVTRTSVFRLSPSGSAQTESPPQPIRILFASTSATHSSKKSSLEVKFAGYLIEEIPSGGLRVTQVVDLSGFGPLPTFVTKAILSKFIPSSLRKLLALAQRVTPLSPPSDKNGTPSWMPPALEASSVGSGSCSTKRSAEEERLTLMIDELKQMIHDLQHHQQTASYLTDWWKRRGKLASVTGAILAACFTVAYKNGRLTNRSNKVR